MTAPAGSGSLAGRRETVVVFRGPVIPVAGRDGNRPSIFIETGAQICGVDRRKDVIERLGYECYYIAGELDRPAERSVLIEEAHFNHPDVLAINQDIFDGNVVRSPQTSELIHTLQAAVATDSYSTYKKFSDGVRHLPPSSQIAPSPRGERADPQHRPSRSELRSRAAFHQGCRDTSRPLRDP